MREALRGRVTKQHRGAGTRKSASAKSRGTIHQKPEGEFVLQQYIYLVMSLDLAKDTLSDESAPDDAKVLAQAVVGDRGGIGAAAFACARRPKHHPLTFTLSLQLCRSE